MNFININLKKIIFSGFFSFLFIIFLMFGDALNTYDTIFINYFHSHIISYILKFLGTALLGYLLLDNLKTIQNKLSTLQVFPKFTKIFFSANKKSFLYCFLFIFLCHLSVFIAFLPGIWTYDVVYQIPFFLNHDYIETHPILHNLMIYGTWLLQTHYPHLLSGIFLYTVIQNAIMISIYAYCVHTLSKYQFPDIIKFFALLFFALYPTNQIFILIATKDVLFIGFTILTILLLFELYKEQNFFKNPIKSITLILSILLMLLFRHNAIYSYILCLPVYIYFFYKKFKFNQFKKTLCIFLIPLLLYLSICFIKVKLNITPPNIACSMSVPLQQMGRVRLLHDKNLSQQDKVDWINIIPPVRELNYNKYNVDTIKFDNEPVLMLHSNFFDNSIKNNPKRFIKLWAKWGKLYPKDYIDAFLLNTYKYWYIRAQYTGGYPGCYLLIDRYDVCGIAIPTPDLLPSVTKMYTKLFMGNAFQENSLTYIFYAIAWNTWFVFLCFLILIYQKRYDYLIILIMIPAIFLGVLFGPTVVVRYIYQNFVILPLLLALCLKK